MTCPRFIPLLLILTFLINGRAIAAIDLFITQPTRSFTTTNRTLVVKGGVKSSEQDAIIVTINTPAGVSRLSAIKPSIRAITIDLGSVRQLQAVLIRPSVDAGVPIGPRRIFLSVSQDGTLFTEGYFDVAASLDPPLDRIVVNFPNPTAARFIRMEMLEGWAPDKILIESLEFLGDDNQIIQPSISSVSILLDRHTGSGQHFFD